MNRINKLVLVAFAFFTIGAFGQTQDMAFEDVYQLIDQNNFFKAKDVYSTAKNNFSPIHQKFIEAFLDHAFGRHTESNEKIAELHSQLAQFPDSLQIALCGIKADNHFNLYEYREGKTATEFVLENYGNTLSEEEKDELRNGLAIFTALENQPKQTVTINGYNKLKLKKNKTGLKSLTVAIDNDSLDFFLDTGANGSAIVRSVAEKYKMDIIPVSIEVGTSTTIKPLAQIAVCPEFHIGDIKIQNTIFFVLEDKDLSISKLFFKYKVLGVIGYPIMAALKEVQITKDGYFIVPEEETVYADSNMATCVSTIISIEGNPYMLDTGAHETTFFKPYYLTNRDEIEKRYKIKTIRYAGAGGIVKEKGWYVIDAKLNVHDKDIILKKVDLSKEEFQDFKGLWGAIGLDVVEQFEKMILNFNQMFIKFE